MTIEACDRFDRQALVGIHDILWQIMEEVPLGSIRKLFSLTEPIGRNVAAFFAPVEILNPISITSYRLGQFTTAKCVVGDRLR